MHADVFMYIMHACISCMYACMHIQCDETHEMRNVQTQQGKQNVLYACACEIYMYHIWMYLCIWCMWMYLCLSCVYVFMYIMYVCTYSATKYAGCTTFRCNRRHGTFCMCVCACVCACVREREWVCVCMKCLTSLKDTHREVGGWGRVPFSRNLMSPTPRRKWYLTTGRRAH